MVDDTTTFYLAFKDVKPSWSLIGYAVALATIATIGIIFNFCVIFVTFRSKSLRGTVNYLLALCSFFELVHEFGHFLFVYNAFSCQNFIEYRLAAKIIFVPAFAFGTIIPLMLFTGIDRLFAILLYEIESKLKICLYLTMVTMFTVSYGFVSSFFWLNQNDFDGDRLQQPQQQRQQVMVTGNYVDLLKPCPFDRIGFFLLLITCLVYLIVGIVIRVKTAGLPSSVSFNQRAFRSLFCIIAVNVGGYFISSCFVVFVKPTIASPITAWFAQVIVALPLNIGSASNAPILYFTSTDYRSAFQTGLPVVFKRISNANRTTPIQQQPTPLFTSS